MPLATLLPVLEIRRGGNITVGSNPAFSAKSIASLNCGAIFLLSSLGEGVVGGLLILEYQKSSLTHHTLTQLRKAVLVR